MLKRLTLINFQKHKHLVIDFNHGITSIVGRTDVGKSAIIRALRWVCLNKPDGDDFIHHGASTAKVVVETDSYTITREKGAGKNEYKLGKKAFKAFGRGKVPEEIQKALQMEAINFQGQFDTPFWIGESAGEVSRQLNQIVNLGIIDHTLHDLSSSLRKSRVEIEVSEQRMQDLRKEHKRMSKVPELVEEYEEGLVRLDEKIQDKHKEIEQASVVLRLLNARNDKKNQLNEIKRLIEKGSSLLQLGRQIQQNEELLLLLKQYSALKTKSRAKKMDFSVLEDTIEIIDNKETDIELLIRLVEKLEHQEQKKCRVLKNLDQRKEELSELIGDRCPICDRPM